MNIEEFPMRSCAPLKTFTTMPYTRLDLAVAMSRVSKSELISDLLERGSLHVALMWCQSLIIERGVNPYKPSARVIRQALIDFETHGRFFFKGESG